MIDKGERRCTAKSKQTGQRCNRWACIGRKVCVMHGGKTPMAGPSHPSYKTGRYSNILPAALKKWYEASLNSPDLLQQVDEVATLQARLMQLKSGVADVGESARAWREASRLYAEWQTALGRIADRQAANDAAGAEVQGRIAAELSTELGAVLRAGSESAETWIEILRTQEQHRKIVESERRRMVESSETMHVTQLSVMFDVLFGVIANEVYDADILERIAGGFSRVLGRPHSPKTARQSERTQGADGDPG